MYDISRLLRDNPYPGRGIVLGRSGDDRCSVLAYFIMGRRAATACLSGRTTASARRPSTLRP